jgi:hypothetical protein
MKKRLVRHLPADCGGLALSPASPQGKQSMKQGDVAAQGRLVGAGELEPRYNS